MPPTFSLSRFLVIKRSFIPQSSSQQISISSEQVANLQLNDKEVNINPTGYLNPTGNGNGNLNPTGNLFPSALSHAWLENCTVNFYGYAPQGR